MSDKMVISGLEATGRGAIAAGCQAFYGYPITPQSDLLEFMARELPKHGGVFIQSESETAAIYMIAGSSQAGARAMSGTSGPGMSLFSEGMSFLAGHNFPAVIVNVARTGPGIGSSHGGQNDYRQVTKGGGHGGYRCIVLAPFTAQEHFDFIQLAFHLADKYRNPVIILSDGLGARTVEPVEIKTLDFGPLPPKDWAVITKGKRSGRKPAPPNMGDYVSIQLAMKEKHEKMEAEEIRYATYEAEDAEILLVAYGGVARAALGAVELGRQGGIKVGLFRPITLWPFPKLALRESAWRAGKVLVVEDSVGQLVEDVDFATLEKVPVQLLGLWGKHLRSTAGLIYPETILEEVKKLL